MSAIMATGSENCLAIGTRVSDFEITGVLGEGGFGIVYVAFDHSLQRNVAIKEYMPGMLAARGDDHSITVRAERHQETFNVGLKSFINEARFLAQFDHPALVKVHRFWEQNQTAYTAMKYYEGRTIKDIVTSEPEVVTQQWCLRILTQILEALEMLYTMKILHRDISPDNIIVQENGEAVLLDFGSARQIIGDRTRGLTVILKPGYAPIEQYAGDASLDQGPYTDIYALSAVMYFAIVKDAPATSIARMVKDPITPLAERGVEGFTREFLAAIDKGLAVLAQDRPQTIDAFRTLLGIASSGTPPARASGASQRFATVDRVPDAGTAAGAASVPVTAMPLAPPAPEASAAGPGAGAAESTPPAPPAPAKPVPPVQQIHAPLTVAPPSIKKAKLKLPSPRPAPANRKVIIIAAVTLAALIGIGVAAFLGRPSDTIMVAPAQNAPAAAVPAPAPAPVAVQPPLVTDKPPAPDNKDPLAALTQATPEPGAPATPPAGAAPDSAAAAAAAAAAPGAAVDPGNPLGDLAKVEPPPEATYRLAIKPWGTVYVDGKQRGASPPLKQLKLSAGKHRIRVVNPSFPDFTIDVNLGKNKTGTIEHDFSAAPR